MDIKSASDHSGGNQVPATVKPRSGAVQAQAKAQGRKADGTENAGAQSSAKKAEAQTEQAQGKTIFAVDSNNRVVIQMLDANGKVLQQLPPEEFAPVAKELKALMKNLFSREA